jgi:hypothetical protein
MTMLSTADLLDGFLSALTQKNDGDVGRGPEVGLPAPRHQAVVSQASV